MRGMPLLNIEEGCCGLLLTGYKDFDPAFFQKFLYLVFQAKCRWLDTSVFIQTCRLWKKSTYLYLWCRCVSPRLFPVTTAFYVPELWVKKTVPRNWGYLRM